MKYTFKIRFKINFKNLLLTIQNGRFDRALFLLIRHFDLFCFSSFRRFYVFVEYFQVWRWCYFQWNCLSIYSLTPTLTLQLHLGIKRDLKPTTLHHRLVFVFELFLPWWGGSDKKSSHLILFSWSIVIIIYRFPLSISLYLSSSLCTRLNNIKEEARPLSLS